MRVDTAGRAIVAHPATLIDHPAWVARASGTVTFTIEHALAGAGVGDDITVGSITCASP